MVIRTGLAPGDSLFFDKQSRVLVNSPRFVRAFELAREVRRNRLDAKVIAWSSDWAEGFKRGAIATQMSGAWLAGHLATWIAPNTKGLWRAAHLPENTFVAYGGTFYAIPRFATQENKAMAWEFIRFMTLREDIQLNAFKTQDAFPALIATHNDPFFEQSIEFLGGQTARLGWRQAASRIKAVEVHKQDTFANEVVNTELDKVLERGKDIPTALADAARILQQRAHR
jgi:multiple sugar transport system substrate-binding protein